MLRILVCVTLLVAGAVWAGEHAKLVGTWRLVAFETEFQATGERKPMYGNATGYFIFTPEGRAMVVIAGEGRKPADTDAARAALLRSMFAYTGLYRVEGDKFITKVDVSWNETWTGTDQTRFFKLEGDRLYILSAWLPGPNFPGNPTVRGVLTWEREK